MHWPRFKFIASSRRGTFRDKIVYDAGGVLLLFLKLLFDWKIKVVHIHTAAGGSFLKHRYYAALARAMGRKVVMHSHASRFKVFYSEASEKQKRAILSSLNSVDRLIVLSRSWKEWFESIGVDPSKIRILNNITSRAELDHVPSADGVARLLFLGEIGERKGVFDLLRAVSGQRDSFEGRVRIHIGGNGQVERLLETIRTDSLEGIVSFEGFVSGTKKEKLLAHSDIFILPSFNEGLPISILEAMSHGCAIVSTPVGGIPEVVSDANGLLVEPGDSEAIADGSPVSCR
jgi:Glycosyltransferase